MLWFVHRISKYEKLQPVDSIVSWPFVSLTDKCKVAAIANEYLYRQYSIALGLLSVIPWMDISCFYGEATSNYKLH